MRSRYLLGLSNANRKAAGVATGDEVEVEVEIDAEPRVVAEPADFARALDADPAARTAYDRLSYSRKREHVLAIESAKKPQTRKRLIAKALAMLRDGSVRRSALGVTPIGGITLSHGVALGERAQSRRYLKRGFGCPCCNRRGCFVGFLLRGGRVT